jgi:nitroimidazol reductase NimA-like FMN-containing flavoprotein (pyridoxamine 5'-phosphate oxidase superfamily)
MTTPLPRDTDMLPEEIAAFLETRRVAALATIAADGSPRVVPATFESAGASLLLRPSGPSVATTMMSDVEAEEFLLGYRYANERSTPPFVLTATRRKDGSPLAVPLGSCYERGAFYLSINNVRTIHHRLRRDPRIALGVFSTEPPLRAVVATGVAERLEDPANEWSRKVFRRHMQPYPWLDFEAYLSEWLAVGRTVYRVDPETFVGWIDNETGAPAALEAAEPDPSVSFAAFSEEAPTVVVLFAGRARPRDASEGGGYDLTVEARSAWDSRKQPAERWEKGEGSHIEGGTWIPVG